MKFFIVKMIENIEFIVIFVTNFVSKDIIKIISNHKPILIINLKEKIISNNSSELNMSLLCEVCDRRIIENESEYKDYIATMRKKNDKSLYKKHTFNDIKLYKVDEISNVYITTYNRKFDLCFINCEF